MVIPTDPKLFATTPTNTAALPTPAQTPQSKGFPTPIADSYGDIFNLEAQTPPRAAPAYTNAELEGALTPPPVPMTIWYGTHVLHGMFYYMPSLLFQLYERFMDISPSELPRLGDGECKPWVVFHEVQDKTWVDEGFLRHFDVDTGQLPNNEPRFVAVTDRLSVIHNALWNKVSNLGTISLHGNFECNSAIKAPNSLMVALLCNKPLSGTRRALNDSWSQSVIRTTAPPKKTEAVIHIKDYTPAPASSAVLDAVQTMLSAGAADMTLHQHTPKRDWIIKNLPEHLTAIVQTTAPSTSSASSSTLPATTLRTSTTPQQRSTRTGPFVLAQSSPLWAQRGNEALFKRTAWAQLCYTSNQTDVTVESKGGVKIPEPYWQVLFEDLQSRERIPGGEELSEVDAKWYAGGVARSVGGRGGRENAVRKVEDDGFVSGAVGGSSCAGVWEEGNGVVKVEGGVSMGDRTDVD